MRVDELAALSKNYLIQGNEELLRAFIRYMYEEDLYQTEKFQDIVL